MPARRPTRAVSGQYVPRMTFAHGLVVAGLTLAFVGTVLTAITLAPGEWLSRRSVQLAQRDLLETTRTARKMGYVSPPYPAPVVTAKLAEADRLFDEESAALDERIHQAAGVDQQRREVQSRWGLLLIAVGSMLQGWATLIG